MNRNNNAIPAAMRLMPVGNQASIVTEICTAAGQRVQVTSLHMAFTSGEHTGRRAWVSATPYGMFVHTNGHTPDAFHEIVCNDVMERMRADMLARS